MTIFEKYPEIRKGRLTMLQGMVSKLYDAGKTVEQIVKETKLPEKLVNDLIAIKEKAEENRKKMNR